jgi:AcrR family transcriptional regulator
LVADRRTHPKPPGTHRRLTASARRELIEQAALQVFTERGYHGAAIDEIARRAGVTPPVFYDHFESKLALHKRLLERTRDELIAMWTEELSDDLPPDERIPRAFDAWARYVELHPYAPRMFFVETTGDPEIQAIHREVQGQARGMLAAILGRQPGGREIADSGDALALEMAAEVIRAGLTGLAIWWTEHPDVPREQIVATAINAIWIGLERAARGDHPRDADGSEQPPSRHVRVRRPRS